MSEWKFDSLQQIKTPDAWLEKAAAIPTTVQKKRVIPLYRIAAAASIVLVSVIGLLLFLFLGDGKAPIAVRSRSVTASENATDETVVDHAGNTGTPAPAETIAVLSTDAAGNTVITYVEVTEPVAAGTQPTNGRQKPTESTLSPTTSSAPTDSRATDAPDQPSPTSSPDAVTESTAAPDPPATELLPTQKPTEASYIPPGDCEIYGMFTMNTVSGSGYNVAEDDSVFCRLYDSSGSLVGDSPLYSPQRVATIISRYDNGMVVAYYNPTAMGLYLTEDSYEYVFYDVHGNELYRDIKFVF